MKRKHILLTGAVLTSLVVAMDLMWNLPVWVRTPLFILAGLALTYYAALSYKLDREKDSLEELLAIEKEIEKQPGEDAEHFKQLIKRLLPCEEVFYGRELTSLGLVDEKALNRLKEMAEEKRGLILNQPDKIRELGIDRHIKSLLFLHNGKKGPDERLVLCINSEPDMFGRYDLQIVMFLLDKIVREERRHELMKNQAGCWQELVYILVDALEKNSPLFIGHGKRVERIAALLGERLGLSDGEKEVLALAALLHDVGRSIPHEEDEEGKDKHAVYGAELFPTEGVLGEVRKAIYHHHERYDGSGMPEGLKYEEIPFISRIIAVADVYDAVVYINREGEELNHALGRAVIKKATGTLFDPLVVAAMEEIEKEVEDIYLKG